MTATCIIDNLERPAAPSGVFHPESAAKSRGVFCDHCERYLPLESLSLKDENGQFCTWRCRRLFIANRNERRLCNGAFIWLACLVILAAMVYMVRGC